MVKVWPIVIAAVSAMLLAGGVAGAKPAPVRMGVVLKDLDNPFFVAMYEGVRAEAGRRGARFSVRAAKSETDLWNKSHSPTARCEASHRQHRQSGRPCSCQARRRAHQLFHRNERRLGRN